jgi:LmbE family N-acetylglucosaminyl deacetylase
VPAVPDRVNGADGMHAPVVADRAKGADGMHAPAAAEPADGAHGRAGQADRETVAEGADAGPALAPVRGLRRLPQAVLDARMRRRAIDRLEGRLLVLAPHPDDETLGCGGTILRSTGAGQPVDIVFATDGNGAHPKFLGRAGLAARRRREGQAAAAALGVAPERVHCLGFDDGSLTAHQDDVATALTPLMGDLRPDHVLVPSRLDTHRDHVALGVSVRAALRGSGCDADVLEYPVWFWDHWPWVPFATIGGGSSRRRAIRTTAERWLGVKVLTEFTVAVDVADVLDRKRRALACHETQMTRPDGHPEVPIMGDVGDGHFLHRFFRRYEIFHRHGA